MAAVLDLTSTQRPGACQRCGTELSPAALACPACAALVHRARLEQLAATAAEAEAAGDRASARAAWLAACDLVPSSSEQHRAITERLAILPMHEEPIASASRGRSGSWWARVSGGAATAALLLAGKFKLLLLGLTKLTTLVSMFGFIGVYWSLYGWPLAVGLAASIYIHEMGHVSMLRRLGIQAGAPLFIPGVGALVMLREHVTDPVVDARIGLAGPVWGLSAGVAAWLVYAATAAPIWLAVAELTGFINLFNLIPIWQLDGSRGFHALSAQQRWMVVAVIGATVALTGVGVLWLVGAVAVYRTIRSAEGPGHAPSAITFSLLVVALSWLARTVG